MMSIRYLLVFSIWLMGCVPYKLIDVPSENLNSRIDYIVLHATSQNFDESLNTLTKQSDYPVSSHYLIPHLDDESYDRNDLAVYRLVPEGGRAWHAGKSNWADEVSLNDRSIGIEIVNEFSCTEHADITNTPTIDFLECQFLPYPKNQIALLIVLLQDILARHPEINPIDIVSHADIAPERKSDPGPYFPWKELYDAGIGAWYDEEDFEKHMKIFAFQLPEISVIQQALSILGYSVEETGEFDEQTRYALRAMQLHYRSTNYKGELDVESVAILFSLIEKYRVLEIDDLIN